MSSLNNKIQKLQALKTIIRNLKGKGKRIVFTNGCFDIIHPGHIKVFNEAKKNGDILIVAVNSDESIKKIKGEKRPIFNQKARISIITSLEAVDYAILFKEPTPKKLIEELKPDILVKGGDWRKNDIVGKDIVKKVIRVNPLKGYSTTSVIEKILALYNN